MSFGANLAAMFIVWRLLREWTSKETKALMVVRNRGGTFVYMVILDD